MRISGVCLGCFLVGLSTVSACTGKADTDSGLLEDENSPVGWEPYPEPLERDGVFQYTVSAEFLWDEQQGVSWNEEYAFAQAFFFESPVAAASAGLDGSADVCWEGIPRDDGIFTYADVGETLRLDVGDDSVQMNREVYDPYVEYWWYPAPAAPAFAMEAGRPLTERDVDLGLEIVDPLVLTEFDSAWAVYVESGVLNLTWVEGTTPDARIEIWFVLPDAETYTACVLQDDGKATIEFPGPPPKDAYPSWTSISRKQPSWADLQGRNVRTGSDFAIIHVGPM